MSIALHKEASWSVTPQAFEAEVFGAPVWRLTVGDATAPRLGELEEIIRDARRGKAALIVCRVPSGAVAAESLEAAGFYRVERLVTLRRDIPAIADMPAGVGLAEAEDADAAVEIARNEFSCDRYHADPKISNDHADEIKARWARNGLAGRSDAVFIARTDGEVAGFNLCMRREDTAAIDLIAVAGRKRGQGIGRKLVEAALAHYAGLASVIQVGTQEDNLASIALYHHTGFAQHDIAETWHWTP